MGKKSEQQCKLQNESHATAMIVQWRNG